MFASIKKKHVRDLENMGFADITALDYPIRGIAKMNDFGGINAVAYDRKTGVFTGVGDSRRLGSAMGPEGVADRD